MLVYIIVNQQYSRVELLERQAIPAAMAREVVENAVHYGPDAFLTGLFCCIMDKNGLTCKHYMLKGIISLPVRHAMTF